MKKHGGFSLLEVIIVIFISAVVVLAVFEIYITLSKTYLLQHASINASSGAAAFVNELQDMAHQADAIETSASISGTTYTSGSTTVVFELPAVNSSGDVLSNTYDYVTLYATSTNAYRVIDANASSARVDGTKKLSDVVQNLTFTYDTGTPSTATAVTIDMTTATTVKSNTVQTRLKQQVYLRNN